MVNVLVVSRDLTARRRAEEAVHRSEERYRSLFNSMTEGFAIHELVTDAAGRPVDYRFLDVNPAFERLTGLKRQDLIGRTFRQVLPGDDSRWVEEYGRVALTGVPAQFENYSPVLRRHHEVCAFRNAPMQFGVVFMGVTDRKAAQDALAGAKEAAEEANRQKDHFLAVLSHELRNPLTPIANSVHVLERSEPGGDRARRAQAVIGRQAAQLSRLVEDLLDVTRLTRNKIQLQRRRVELGELVRAAVEDQRSVFEAGAVRLAFAGPGEPVVVDADPHRLAQIVGNLLQNAAKFTPRGGATTVTVSLEASSGRAVVAVRDTGIGMTPEVLSRVFEPFVQADTSLARSKGGLGLGLALVRGLVGLHGGEVSARSAGPGLGAEIVVRLPLAREDADRDPPRVTGTCGRRRVLVIEDNVDAAETLRDALELGGHEVLLARDGPEGIARARDWEPDVILCDLGLPGMDGFEVARALRKDGALPSSTRLIAISGYAQPEDRQRAREAGFEAHLAKPPSIDELYAVLSAVPEVVAGSSGA